jgi:hypothetical protein
VRVTNSLAVEIHEKVVKLHLTAEPTTPDEHTRLDRGEVPDVNFKSGINQEMAERIMAAEVSTYSVVLVKAHTSTKKELLTWLRAKANPHAQEFKP